MEPTDDFCFWLFVAAEVMSFTLGAPPPVNVHHFYMIPTHMIRRYVDLCRNGMDDTHDTARMFLEGALAAHTPALV